jgi:hypothetical protein
MVNPYPEPTTLENLPNTTINTINWKYFSPEIRELGNNILDIFSTSPNLILQCHRGSHSIKQNNKVIAKIIPIKNPNEALLLGFSTTTNPKPTEHYQLLGPYLVKGQPFLFTEINPGDWQKQEKTIRDLIELNSH